MQAGAGHRQQRRRRRGQRAEAVLQLGLEMVDRIDRRQPRQPRVQRQTDVDLGNPVFGQAAGDAEIEFGRPVFDGFAARRAQRRFEQVVIEVDADQLDVPGLGIAEQVARAAHVEVARADVEACAEPVERLERLQPFQGARGDLVRRIGQQQDLPAPAAAPDPAAQLMQLRQPETIGAPDEHRVRPRHVEPGLDDVGRQQHIAVATGELDHRLVDLGGGQLAVRFAAAQLGDQRHQLLAHARHVLDARYDDEALPATRLLAQQRGADADRLERPGAGADRLAAGRGRGDQRQLLQPDQRRLQRPWDRRRGQCQDMAAFAQVAKLGLVGGTEALLLVDDDEREVVIIHAFARDRGGADDDPDRAIGKPRPGRLLLRRTRQSG